MDIIQAYSRHFAVEYEQDQDDINIFDDEYSDVDSIIMTKKLSFLKTILYLFPNQQLRKIIDSRTNYAIQIM